MSIVKQKPTTKDNLVQWDLYQKQPKEKRYNKISASLTIFGEAPAGVNEADPSWLIWKEERDNAGNIFTTYAQGGRNDLRWIYNEIAFDPVSDPTRVPPATDGTVPYAITLSNDEILDGTPAGTVIGALTVFDDNSVVHTLTIVNDPFNFFNIVAGNLVSILPADITDVAYPVRIRATDPEGNAFETWLTVTVVEAVPTPAYTFARTQSLALSDVAWTEIPAIALDGRTSLAIQNQTGFQIEVAYDDGIAYGEGMIVEDGNERQYNEIPAIFRIYARLEPGGAGSIRVEEIAE